ncbi:MAG: dihydrodipicolinate synthase family protein, partial [Thermotogaceae bacterium]|nr:dihydrodipicolinate synthase family protein [Thermotogaceae bacterium]
MLKLVAPNLTKFNREGNIILDAEYTRFIKSLINHGVDVLMPCGTNSEFHTMSIDERKQLIEFIWSNFKDSVEIVPHVGASSFKETVTLADFSFSLGIGIVSIVAPYYFKYDDDAIVEYFVSIAKIFSDRKILLYNIPVFSGNRLEIHHILKIRSKVDNVIGMKDSDSRPWIARILKTELGNDFIIYGGNDKLLIDYLIRGADGQVSGTANIFPKLLKTILTSYENKNFEKASKLQNILDEVVDKISGYKAFVGA